VRVLGEDVEDQGRPVQHAQVVPEGAFQFALVARRELIIEDDDIGQALIRQVPRRTNLLSRVWVRPPDR
jgi:hypothetical protein